VVDIFVNLLNPLAPHITEEIAEKMGIGELAYSDFPDYEPELVKDETIEMAVQINGKVRGQFEIEKDADKEKCIEKALNVENVQRHLEGEEIVKKIVVPNKLVSIVVK
jgi:leucyl-tRNA synthetase